MSSTFDHVHSSINSVADPKEEKANYTLFYYNTYNHTIYEEDLYCY